jgi:HEAT repeat protein
MPYSEIATLIERLLDPSERVRAKAAIDSIGFDSPQLNKTLLQIVLNDPSDYVSCLAVHALRFTRQPAPCLCSALLKARPMVAVCLLKAIRILSAANCLEPIRQLLSHSEWFVRLEAAITLTSLRCIDGSVLSTFYDLASKMNARQLAVSHIDQSFVPDAMLRDLRRARRRLGHYLGRAQRQSGDAGVRFEDV